MIPTTFGRLWLRSIRPRLPTGWPPGAAIFAIAHEDTLFAAALFRPRDSMALVSRSRDGEALARILDGGRMRLVRGSSSSGAVPASRAILRGLAAGLPLVTAFDGPRGPAGVAKPGPARLADLAEIPVRRLRFEGAVLLRAKDWSRLRIPRPLSRPAAILEEYSP